MLIGVVAALAVVAGDLSAVASSPSPERSFTFGAAGDFGANPATTATFQAVAGSGSEFFIALGDLAYRWGLPESSWCDSVTSSVGATYPFEILAGNHENVGRDGRIENFAACLPNRLQPMVGRYGKEYYVDYPAGAPLARMIMISPGLTPGPEGTYDYNTGSSHLGWLAGAIDGARAGGIPWVIVAMHEHCMGLDYHGCSIGVDLHNFLAEKKVDLVLQAHAHSYGRSAQLVLGPACPALQVGVFNPACVVNDGSSGDYTKGAGPVTVISGTGGDSIEPINSAKPEVGYFATLMGAGRHPTFGFVQYTVSASRLTGRFVVAAGDGFTDTFTITAPKVTPPTTVPITPGGTAAHPPTTTPSASTTTTAPSGPTTTTTPPGPTTTAAPLHPPTTAPPGSPGSRSRPPPAQP